MHQLVSRYYPRQCDRGGRWRRRRRWRAKKTEPNCRVPYGLSVAASHGGGRWRPHSPRPLLLVMEEWRLRGAVLLLTPHSSSLLNTNTPPEESFRRIYSGTEFKNNSGTLLENLHFMLRYFHSREMIVSLPPIQLTVVITWYLIDSMSNVYLVNWNTMHHKPVSRWDSSSLSRDFKVL